MALTLSDGVSSLPIPPPLPTPTPNSSSTRSSTLSSVESLLSPLLTTTTTNLNSTSPFEISHPEPTFPSSSVKTMSQAVKLAVIFVAIFFVLALIGVGMWRFGSRYIVANYKLNGKNMEKREKIMERKKGEEGEGEGEGDLEKGEGEGGNQGEGGDVEAGREDGQQDGVTNAG